MTTFFIDFIVNVSETIALFCLLLSIFLFPIRSYGTQMLFTSIIMGQTSYIVREVFHLDNLTPLFMLGWMIILIWLLFRVHLFYALLMAVTGYFVYVAVQMIFIFVIQWLLGVENLTTDFYYQKMLQVICSIIALFSSYILSKKRIGFSFVPDRSYAQVPLIGVNRALLHVLIVSSVIIIGIAYSGFEGKLQFAVSAISVLTIISIIIQLALWKERKE